jgi:ribosomal protein L31
MPCLLWSEFHHQVHVLLFWVMNNADHCLMSFTHYSCLWQQKSYCSVDVDKKCHVMWKGEGASLWWGSKFCSACLIRNELLPLLLVCQQTRHRLRNNEQIFIQGLVPTPITIRRLLASRFWGQLRVCWVGTVGQTTWCDSPIKRQGGGPKILTINCHHHVVQTGQAMHVWSKNEVLLRHLFCRGKVRSIKYSECVCSFSYQHAWRMCRIIVTCSLSGSTIFLHTYNRHDLRENVIEEKTCSDLLYNVCTKHMPLFI